MTEAIQLHGFSDNDRSGKVRWIARELGLAVEEQRLSPPEHHAPPYVALNPLAQVPTVRFRGETLLESTAICHALAEAFTEPKLWIGPGEPGRRAYLFWLAAFAETLEGRLVECAVSKLGILPPAYFSLHEGTVRRKLGVLAARLPKEGYLAGERFTVADVVAGYNLRLGVQVGLLERAAAEPYLGRLVARPAAQESRVFASLGA